jgi:hypothetical protein
LTIRSLSKWAKTAPNTYAHYYSEQFSFLKICVQQLIKGFLIEVSKQLFVLLTELYSTSYKSCLFIYYFLFLLIPSPRYAASRRTLCPVAHFICYINKFSFNFILELSVSTSSSTIKFAFALIFFVQYPDCIVSQKYFPPLFLTISSNIIITQIISLFSQASYCVTSRF